MAGINCFQKNVRETYGVTFDLMSKIDVDGRHHLDLYDWLINSTPGRGRRIQWNFTSFVINRSGKGKSRKI